MNGLSKVTGKFTDFAVLLPTTSRTSTQIVKRNDQGCQSINAGITARDNHLRTACSEVEVSRNHVSKQPRPKEGKQLTDFGTFTMHGVSKISASLHLFRSKQRMPPATN
jgi:polyisoprenoid-binding protein YceI